MKQNVGTVDRIARYALGLAILNLGIFFQSWWALLGLVLLLTAIFRTCPAYLPFNYSSP